MWRCPNCGEQNEDQFDSCWRCVKTGPAEGERLPRQRESWWFFRYWRRGWAILLLVALVGLCARFAVYVSQGFINYSNKLTSGEFGRYAVPLLALVLVLVALPVFAYLVFSLLFGEEAWTWGKKARAPSPEETASALFEQGARLEGCGNLRGARDAYAEVVQDYSETAVAQHARKRLESLRAPTP
jgi:hypothetical protein